MKQLDFEKAQCMKIESLMPDKHKMQHKFVNRDILEECMINSLHNEDQDGAVLNKNVELIEVVLSLNEGSNVESSSSGEVKVLDAEKSFKGLILKELPKHLKYAFLGKERSKLMIIVANLTSEKEKKVVEILRKHKEAIAWSTEDLKGSSHLFVCRKSSWRIMQGLPLNTKGG